MSGLRDASRMLSVVESVIDKNINSGAGIHVTYGQVFQIDLTTGEASVYLAGSRELAQSDGGTADPTPGFRLPSVQKVNVNDYVRVSIDKRGHRWINEIIPNSLFAKLQIDVNNAQFAIGDGLTPPLIGAAGQFPIVNPSSSGMQWETLSDLVFIPFVKNTVLGTGTEEMNFDGIGTSTRVHVPWTFEVVGLSIRTSDNRTAGTLTAKARIAGTDTTLSAVLDGTNVTWKTSSTTAGFSTSNLGVAGGDVGMVYTTSGWTPTNTLIYGGIWLVVRRFAVALVRNGSFTANAVLQSAVAGQYTFTANAVLRSIVSGTFTSDAVLRKIVSGTFTADAVLASTTPPPSGFTGLLGTSNSELENIILGKG